MRSTLRLLVRLYPVAFRERFGAAMFEQIDHDYARARARSIVDAIAFGSATLADLAWSCIAEHWNPTWTSATPSQEHGMRSIVA